ncbi:gliding motility-associated C-terminal domain-containing protein [Flavobacterium caeni]|uniref:Gliding motility-associated C-terminal domain-containing protein n=1 Tax=Flavobacterium caeni TaxID=490189 RepID=A0A1G5JLX4_9FLAO|nr:gliding motility-associated C-terminal domain-containing protein [Flavobacterium caeni]SCY88921.1 gliding motility-associated C-terminal domain-containing protein [Flavobacterium caeni]
MRIITLIQKNTACLVLFLTVVCGFDANAQCPTVVNPNQSFCDINSPTVANLAATNNGGGVVWYAAATGGTPLSPAAGLVNGEDYFADSVAGCGNRQVVNVTIYGAPTGLNFQGVCVDIASSATISDLQAVGNNVQWYSVSTGGVPLPPSTVLVDNTIYYASQTNPDTGCETSRLSVFVNVGVVPVPTGSPTQQFCVTPANTPTVANLTASGNNNWYLTGTSAAPLALDTPLINGQSYFATTVDPPCESIDRFEVLVTLFPPSDAGANGTRSICINNIPTTAPFNLFGLLGGTPQTTGVWTGPIGTTNGHLGTLNVSTMTVAGSPYVFTYTVDTGVCAAASSTVTINVLPMPTATVAANTTVCSGNNATVTFTGTPNATITYTTNPGGTQTIVLNSSGTATLTTAYTVTTTITLVSAGSATTPSCVQPLNGSITITVLPLPTATIASNVTVCSGGSATVTFTGTPNATVTYTASPGGTQTITLNGSGTATITGNYTTTTTYTLVSIVSSGTPACTRPLTGSVVVTVLPVPTATISANATICSGQSATVTFTGTPNATVTYTANPGGTQTITLNGAGTATLTNTYTTTTTFTLVSITTAGTPSCTVPLTGSITITVLPPPTATIAANTTVCSGANATVTFTGTPNATITYTVNPGGTQTITLNGSGTATLTNAYTITTTYTLVSVASTGTPSCTTPLNATITITVVPPPTVSISSNATVCPNGSATVTFTGTPNATVTYTANPGGTQTITLNASGTATLTNNYTVTTTYTLVSVATTGTPSCSQPASGTITITVQPLPTATIASNATVCSGGSATVTFMGTPNATVTYTANPGGTQTIVLNASGTATLTNTYTTTTTYTLVSVATTGTPSCSQPVTGTVTITVAPPPTASIAANATVCAGQPATITFTGTPNATVTYTANPGGTQTITLNASGTATITANFTTTTVYTLVSVASAGTPSCTVPASGTITITVIPPPTVSISSNATVCPNGSATVTFTGTPNATVTYTANPGGMQTITLNASGTATLTNNYSTTTTYTLVSISTGGTQGCTQPVSGSITITVAPLPVVAISSDATVCPNGSATVTFTGTPNATVTYTVSPGGTQTITLNGSGTATLTNNYATTTTYTLVSVATTGTPSCSQPVTGSITITVSPLPTATMAADATICAGQQATITFTGTPNATIAYSVNPGGNQTIVLNASGTATITNSYSATTVYTLLSATSTGTPGCSQPLTGSVTITVVPPPTVSIASNQSVCPNGSATVTFTGTPNATVTYMANPGGTQTITLDASGTATLTSNYTVTTTYTLVSVATSATPNCSQPATGSITITVVPLPMATIALGTTTCSGSPASVTVTGTPNATVNYTLTPGGNGIVVLNASGTGTITGNFTTTTVITLTNVTLAGTPACSQPLNAMATITVVQPPVAGNNAVFSLCADGSPQDLFLLLGSSAQTGGTWSPALASGTGVFNPALDPSGTYTYTLAGTPPCLNATASVTVTVVQPSNAGTSGTANLCSNQDPIDLFSFLGGSPQTGGTWTPSLASGTGLFNPAVDTAGVYTYTLAGTPPCSGDSATVTVLVTPGPDAGISGNAVFCQDSTPQDLFLSLGGTPQVGGTWSPALASGTGVFDPTVDAPGVYTYTFEGNQPCDDDTATVTVTINPIPDAGLDGTAFFCTNYPAADLFTFLGGAPQTGGTWSPALASGTGVFDPLVDAAGVYTYTVGGGFCSTDTATITVSVSPSPNAGGAGATLLIDGCSTDTAIDLFTGLNGSQGVGTWNDDDATGALTGNIFNASLVAPGTYHFTYTVGGGVSPCLTDSATVTVVVSPVPNAGMAGSSQSFCNATGSIDLFTLISGYSPGGDWVDSNNLVVNNNLDISAFVAGTYSYTYQITTPCGTDSEKVQFTIVPTPTLTSGNVTIGSPVCVGSPATVTLTGLADGNYLLTYNLSGANTLPDEPIAVTIVGGTGSFAIGAGDIPNTGTTTITFVNIGNTATNCVTTLTDVAVNFSVNPLVGIDSAQLSVTNICLGNDAVVVISGAAGLPNGTYQFNYNIPTGTPASGTAANVVLTNGGGTFTVPGAVFGAAGNYTLTITGIVTASGCNNLSENASASFVVHPIPNASGATVNAGDQCYGFDNTVLIGGATSLTDGIYTINYDLSGANISSQSTSVTFNGGAGSFGIPASALQNPGTTTITITQLALSNTTCGITGVTFNAVMFNILQIATPVLETNGEQFCGDDNPTIADLTSHISGTDPVFWYDAETGGNLLNETDALVNGATYYASHGSPSICESFVRLEVTVDLTQCPQQDDLLIPDGFSPNNDGINDAFTIRNLRTLYPNFKLEIYNRYGNLLYTGNNFVPDWNGTTTEGGLKMGGNQVPVGVYFYILEFNDGIRKPVQGRVYLSR